MEKSLKKNVIYNFLYQVVAIVTPIITAPYLARTIGAEGNGVYNYTLTYANFFFLFAMLGVNNYGTRMIAQVKNDKQTLSKTFWEIYTLQLILSVIFTGLYVVFCFCVFRAEERFLSLLQGLVVLASATDINWFAFGIEEFKYTTIRNLVIKILTLISIFVFVKEKADTWVYILIVECGVIMGLLVLWPLVNQKTDFYKPCIRSTIKHIRPNLLLFIPILATSIFQYTDKMMLGIFIDNSVVGHYSYAESIMNVPLSLITTVCTVFMPRISNMISEKKPGTNEIFEKCLYLTTILEIAMVFGVAAVAPQLISLYLGVEFAETARLLVILSIVILLSGTANVIRSMLLIPNSRDVLYVWSIILGAIVNVIGNAFLLPRYGATGACVSTIASYFIVLLIQMVGSRRDILYFPYVMKMIPFVFLGSAMYFLIQLMDSRFNCNSWLLLFLEVFAGIVLYCSGSLIIVAIYRLINKRSESGR